MQVLRRFHNKLVQGTQSTLKSGSPTVYELKELKPVRLLIPREISGYLLISSGAIKKLPLPQGYDRLTERLYCVFRVQGIVAFSIANDDGISNILIKGTQTQQGRYSFSDFVASISVRNPTTSDTLLQYTCFVLPDLADSANYLDLVDQVQLPTDSGGTGEMATTTRVASDTARIDYSLSNVTTGAWTTLIGACSKTVSHVNIFDSSGQTMELGVGGAGSETRIMIIPPGGIVEDVLVDIGQRLAVRAISATADVGEIDISTFS